MKMVVQKATGGYFKGEIHADSGTIGGVSIQTILGAEYEVAIEVTKGTVFKDENEIKTLTARFKNKNRRNSFGNNWYKWYQIVISNNSIEVVLLVETNICEIVGSDE